MSFNLIITKPGQEFYNACAWYTVKQLLNKPESVIGLSTGRTTGGIHKAIADIHAAHPFDVSKAVFFGLDELTGVSPEYFGSCIYMLLNELTRPLGLPDDRLLMLPTASDNWEKECLSFRKKIAEAGGIDLQILGIGENGHIGFNQPGTPFSQRAFTSYMDERLSARIYAETNTPSDIPLGGVTLGIADVLEARSILLCANGKNKKDILAKALYGEVTEELPASVLQRYEGLTVICDTDAASEIK